MRHRTATAHSFRLIGLSAAMIVALAAAAIVTAAEPVIDLTQADAEVTHQGAVFLQGGLGAGTGNFDPFLTFNVNTPTEEGYNGAADADYDQFFGGGRTHPLLVSAVPIVTYEGQQYREFSLDANDQGSETFMSVDDIKIFLDNQDDLTDYEPGTETFGNDDSTAASKVFDLDQPIILSSQDLESGSGVSDITVLLPASIFPEDCYYGSLDCDQYLIFFTQSGFLGTSQGDGRNYDVTAGFEEWRVALQPVVNVSKTVTASVDRTYPWDVTKSANVESIDLFAGDNASIDWTVTATAGEPTDANLAISGTISITNPTGSEVISEKIPATINSVDDVLTQGAVATDLDVNCPVTFPYTLAAGATLECPYTGTPASADSGTNEATANIDISDTETADYSGSAAVAFGVNEIDECVSVTDDNATPGDTSDDRVLDSELCAGDSPGTYNFSTDVGPFDVEDCGSATITNTAYTLTNDSGTKDSAFDSVDVTCETLSVTKTATPAFDRDYDWTVEKSVSDDAIDLFNGDSEEVTWTVSWDRDNGTDGNWSVTGDITITNDSDLAADDVSVADSIGAGITVAVDCDPATAGDQTTVDVAANSSATCSYRAALPDATTRTNTATATLFGVDYPGTASINFSGVNPHEIDATATVTDDRGPLDLPVTGDDSTTYNETFSCGEDAGKQSNTAVVTEADSGDTDDDTAETTVTCHGLTVSKTATTTFSRDYDWSIVKSRFLATGETDNDGDLSTLELAPGQVFTASYSVDVTQTSHQDADWAVHGTITVTNDTSINAEDVVVSDLISPDDAAATVDCDDVAAGDQNTVDVAANSSVECSYAADLTDASARTNVATATLNDVDYDSAAVDVTFDDTPDVQIDECIDVVDDNGTPGDTSDDSDLGTVCLGDLDGNGQKTLTTTIDIGPYEACTTDEVVNTASFTSANDENDTDESGSSTYTINVDVPCPEGCTLTQGYWKTHNDSFKGGAPTDETWQLLGDVDGDGTVEGEGEAFFLSGQTFFQVMWTAPKGNAYYILAGQYIAARLNILAGADPTAAQSAITSATNLFAAYTPDYVAGLKGKGGKELRAQFIELAGTLGSYNEGLIGPGHCDEDGTSSAVFLPIGLIAPAIGWLRRRRQGA